MQTIEVKARGIGRSRIGHGRTGLDAQRFHARNNRKLRIRGQAHHDGGQQYRRPDGTARGARHPLQDEQQQQSRSTDQTNVHEDADKESRTMVPATFRPTAGIRKHRHQRFKRDRRDDGSRRTISRPPIQRWPTGSKCAEVFSSAIAGQVRPPFLPVECYGRFRSSYSPLTELRPISRSILFCIGGWVENKLVNMPPPTSGCAINKCALEGDATMGRRFE